MTVIQLKHWAKGAVIAAAAAFMYAAALWCFIALLLLVISMEEGGENLSTFSMPLAQAIMLLSQGIGFHNGAITLTIVPLLMTLLLIGSIRAIALRIDTNWRSYISGVAVWNIITAVLRDNAGVTLIDQPWLVHAKTSLVFTIGFLLAASRSKNVRDFFSHVTNRISAELRNAIAWGVKIAVGLQTIYLVIGLITVLAWIGTGWSTSAEIFDISGMQNGSAILTSIASLAWLPNVVLWALAWLFGDGFAIGQTASYTLWSRYVDVLPPIPAFGIFPDALHSDVLRMLFLSIPAVCAAAYGLAVIIMKRGFGLRVPSAAQSHTDYKSLVFEFAYPAGAFCIASAMISVCSSLLFALSNGSLGTGRLSHIGVDIITATRCIAQPTALGLICAWSVAAIGVAAIFGIRWISRRVRTRHDASGSQPSTVHEDATPTRVATSTPQHKEEQGDNNESSDTTSSGIGLP